tara:strand:- start:239 stop:439 length:201 start_codon:yes stop_codon:yes gene_type:complete
VKYARIAIIKNPHITKKDTLNAVIDLLIKYIIVGINNMNILYRTIEKKIVNTNFPVLSTSSIFGKA